MVYNLDQFGTFWQVGCWSDQAGFLNVISAVDGGIMAHLRYSQSLVMVIKARKLTREPTASYQT